MNLLDAVVALLAVSGAVTGHRLGLLTRVGSWAGGLAGLAVTAVVAPRLVRLVDPADPLLRFVLAVGVLLAAVAGLAGVGQALAWRVRRRLRGPVLGADRAGGALAGGAAVLVLVWLVTPAMADVPGPLARQARESAVAGWVRDVAPPPPDPYQVLGSLVSGSRFPRVFDDLRPSPSTGAPPSSSAVSAEIRAAVASTVNVEAFGCGGRHEGSGFAAAPDTVMTNAHVVAGAREVRVRRPDGRVLPARVVVFDGDRDLALLSVRNLGQRPLPLREGGRGTTGAVIGYPGGQNRPRVAPAAVREATTAVGQDIYGQRGVRREVLVLAAALRQGDSGGALVDGDGRVVGVAFAIAPDRRTTAYALDTSEARAVLAAPHRPGTGRCI